MMERFLVLTTCALLGVAVLLVDSEPEKQEPVNIKIVEAPALSRFPSMPSADKVLTLRAKPSPLTGPPHLLQLSDQCYTGNEKGYTYKVCMFNNVTQKEDRVGWNSFHGVLGVWHEWVIENDTYTGMYYTMGESCSTSDREAKVMFNCSHSTRLYNFTEPSTCTYHMVLDTPLACFKGAMQVYHTLSADQVKEWDRLNEQFYAEELTFKGLSKRRQKILIDAGLLQEAKKEEITKAPSAEPAVSSQSTELSNCLKEKESLDSQLKDLKVRVLRVVKDYPEIHYKVDLLFNSSFTPSSSPEGPAPSGPEGPPHRAAPAAGPLSDRAGEGGLEERPEALLSDSDMDAMLDDLLDEPEGAKHSEQEVVKDKSFEADNYDLDTFLHDLESEHHI